ncbi:MAG: hypothetical protein AB7I38_18610 [Dehalococcoidia bacterium]
MDWPTLTWVTLNRPGLDGVEAGAIQGRVEGVLASWDGTPYMPGQWRKGAGADCVRFVARALEELFGVERRPIPNLPQDSSWHNTRLVVTATQEIVRVYGPAELLRRPAALQPGDIVVTAPSTAGGPGHVGMVGGLPGRLWHAMPGAGVRFTGLRILGHRFLRAYRPRDVREWLR